MKRKCPFPVSRWGEIEPWPWLRHVTPWWLLRMICNRYHLCWAGMALWKLGYDASWSLKRTCFVPYDYCGWYDHEATRQERAEGLRIACEDGAKFTFGEQQ